MANPLTGKNILVTGGTGLVGSHLIESLIDHHPHKIVTTVRTIDPFSYFFLENLSEQVVLAYGDIRDAERMADIISKHEINYIFHLAAQPIVQSAYAFPKETMSTNVTGTINILEAARQIGGIDGIVIASSDKAYGTSEVLPYTEETKLEGTHPYDSSKSATDLIGRTYHRTYDLPVIVTRFGNIFGPGDDNFNRVIPGVIKALIHKEPFSIRSDGQAIREYLYVKDVVDGYIKAAQQIDKHAGEAFNFGSSHIHSVLSIIEQTMLAFGSKVPLKIMNQAKNEIPAQHLDYQKAKRRLGWEAKSDLGLALSDTISWYKKYFDTINKRRKRR